MHSAKKSEELEKLFDEKFVHKNLVKVVNTDTWELKPIFVKNDNIVEDIKQFINDNYVDKTTVKEIMRETIKLSGEAMKNLLDTRDPVVAGNSQSKALEDLLSKYNIN